MAQEVQFEVELQGVEQLQSKLERAGQKLSDMYGFFTDIGRFLTGFYGSIPFVTQGSIYGDPWAPLSDDYAERKAQTYPGRNLLIATGEMSRGFQADPDSFSVRLYNEVAWFQYHQTGTSKMPQRLVMAIEERQQKHINEALTKYVKDSIDG